MKLLGLDVGNRRVGVAYGDTVLRIATPLDVIERGSITQDSDRLNRLIADYAAERLVVGLPRNTNGTVGEQARSVQDYMSRIEQVIKISVVLWDEHLTTVEATRRTIESGNRGKKSRRNQDAIAAAIILQDYIDSEAGNSQYVG